MQLSAFLAVGLDLLHALLGQALLVWEGGRRDHEAEVLDGEFGRTGSGALDVYNVMFPELLTNMSQLQLPAYILSLSKHQLFHFPSVNLLQRGPVSFSSLVHGLFSFLFL